MAIALSVSAVNAQLDALATLLDDGYIRIYTGQRPASPDTAISNQKFLVELRFSRPAFSSATDGVLKAYKIKTDSLAVNSGNATWYRAYYKDGSTAIIDGDVGTTKDADMILNFVEIQKTANFSLNEFQLRSRNLVAA